MAVTFVCWHWGTKYGPDYVNRLINGLGRHAPGSRVLIVGPEKADEPLTEIPGCLCRLRTFDPAWQASHGFSEGDKIVVIDLDMVITRSLEGLFDRPEPFVILQDVNLDNPGLFNGSLWMLRAGYRPDVWSEFRMDRIEALNLYAFPSDQGWMEHMIKDAGAFSHKDGVYGFCKKHWPPGAALPVNARMVAFFGWRDPSRFTHIPWVHRHWQ